MITDTDHNEIEELLGVFVLDAVDPDESARIDRHLEGCPRCRAEVDAGREVAGQLGTSIRVADGEPLPPGLWDRIAEGLAESSRRPAGPMPGLGDERATVGATAGAEVVDIDEARVTRDRRLRTARRVLAAVAAVAVVAVIALGTALVHTDNQLNQANQNLASGPAAAVHAALATPAHRVVHLNSPNGAQLAEFVMLPSGQGFMVSSSMPTLPSSETYQLWAIIAGKPISIGLLGHQPHRATFTLASSASPSALAVTVEPAGGVTTPSRAPVAAGHLS